MSDEWYEVFQSIGVLATSAALLIHLIGHIKNGDK